MNSWTLVRDASKVLAAVVFVGGYAVHQYSSFQGGEALQNWTERIQGANMLIGWVFLLLAIGLSLAPDTKEQQD